ncbi:hypothetical protein [Streptomyces solaniscabiei]|uniref:hypothetical protein n=1 Tax=Streptomyces solaniscabiei TaxID=2683255 RepID=UPI001CE3A7EA|nr:hypothetical protein [Streptomyces solaniscabiei]
MNEGVEVRDEDAGTGDGEARAGLTIGDLLEQALAAARIYTPRRVGWVLWETK